MSWSVYILRGKQGTLYTGITTDITRRLRQHNGEIAGGAKFTRRKSERPWKVVSVTEMNSKSEAGTLEAQIKKMSKPKKILYIKEHPNI